MLVWLVIAGTLFLPRHLFSAPRFQSETNNGEITLPLIRPAAATVATLHTHVATITLDVDDQGAPLLRIDATFDIRNESKEDILAPLIIDGATPFALTLMQDGVLLTPAVAEDGSTTVQVAIPANARTDIVLTGSRGLGVGALTSIAYPTELLRQWRGQRSVRVNLAPGLQASIASWLHVAPDSWRYAATDDIQLEWLFESDLPVRIMFQAIAPAFWQELQQLTAAATGNAPDSYAALGLRYRQLASAAAELGDAAAQARFLAQAAAAYTEGIRQAEAAGAAALDLVDLHAGLAALYRARVAATDHADDAQAMMVEAGLALQGMMIDDARRGELEQWQVDGLRLMLADLRRSGDIPGALALIERLQDLPAGGSGADFLEQERQALVVQQAVQLIEQGDRATALALAGELIQSPALQPPTQYRNLFARWSVSTTMSARGVEVQVNVDANEERNEDAQAALEAVVQNWRTTPALRAMEPEVRRVSAAGASLAQFELTLHLPAGSNGVELARVLPTDVDWALLRVLLGQLGPQIQTQTNGVWQQVRVTQPIDLRTVGEQWQRIAAQLDRQAAEFEANATGAAGAATLQASQEERLRAANYRATAHAWRTLAQDSQVVISLSTPGTTNEAARAWLVTVSSPPQMLNVQVGALSTGRVLLAGLAALAAIFGLTALLWRLL